MSALLVLTFGVYCAWAGLRAVAIHGTPSPVLTALERATRPGFTHASVAMTVGLVVWSIAEKIA